MMSFLIIEGSISKLAVNSETHDLSQPAQRLGAYHVTKTSANALDRQMARIIDGRAFAEQILENVAEFVGQLKQRGVFPGLAVVLVGDDPASEVYVRNKGLKTRAVGMQSFEHRLPEDTTEAEMIALIDLLNQDPAVHGILVQLPLPKHARCQRSSRPAQDKD